MFVNGFVYKYSSSDTQDTKKKKLQLHGPVIESDGVKFAGVGPRCSGLRSELLRASTSSKSTLMVTSAAIE